MNQSAQPYKVLCAIAHGLYEPWISILNEGQEKTWLKEEFPEGFSVVHYHSMPVPKCVQHLDRIHEEFRWKNIWSTRMLKVLDNAILLPFVFFIPKINSSKRLHLSSPALQVNFPDTYVTYRWKFLALLKYFLTDTDSDFLLVTSTASYINPREVMNFIQGASPKGVFLGAEPYLDAEFVSGSNRIFSRDIAMQILDARYRWLPGGIEDVSVSQLVKKLGNETILFPITNVDSIEELNRFTDLELLGTYHFRLKSFVNGKRNDVKIMHELHARIKKIVG